MDYGIFSIIPILMLLAGALITKRVSEMMVISSIVGALMVYRGDFLTGYISLMHTVLTNHTYQFILINMLSFGALVRLFQSSGAVLGFRKIISSHSKKDLNPLLIAWFLNFLFFINGFLNILVTSFSIRDLTDQHKIPREHLALQIAFMSPSLSAILPITSWTVFTVGLLREQGLGLRDYVLSIPLMFFPITLIIFALLLATGVLPKVGLLRESYRRSKIYGNTLPPEAAERGLLQMDVAESNSSSSLNFIIPVFVLIAFVFLFDNSLLHGVFAAIATQAILYIPQKLMTLETFINHGFEGAISMVRLAIIIFFAYILNEANQLMGFSEYLIGFIGFSIPPFLLPLIAFLFIAFTTFATSGYWVIQVITVPIFIPLAVAQNIEPSLIIAAIMSGVVFGSMLCFYSDTIFMIAAGTGIPNIRQVQVSTPYAIVATFITALAYLIVGIVLI